MWPTRRGRPDFRSLLHHQDPRAGTGPADLPHHYQRPRRAFVAGSQSGAGHYLPSGTARRGGHAMSAEATVFLVDDEADLRKALTRLLQAEGHRVVAFSSAEEFLKLQPATGGCCLILDVSMPGIGGLELQQHLTRAGISIPIIFLTGRSDIPMSVRALKGGAADFLTKPVDASKLLPAVRAALQKSAAQQVAD